MSDLRRAKQHSPLLYQQRHSHALVHGQHRAGRLNTRLALGVTKLVGSMWCAYAFALLALVSAPAALRSGDPIIIVAWIAQTFLQLVLLPVIIVGQNVQATAADLRAQADHESISALLELANAIHDLVSVEEQEASA